MKVRIQRNQIHHFKEEVLDANNEPTGVEKEVLQFDVQFPDYPDLPTYGMRVDFPITKKKVKDAITVKAQEAKAQMAKDEAIRSLIGEDVLEFNVEV